MNVRTVVLVFIAAAAACGGKTIADPETSTTTGTTNTTPAPTSTSTSTQTSTGSVPITTTSPPTQDDSQCSNNGSSASGGVNADGSSTCMSDTQYVCGQGARYVDINCQCNSTDGGPMTGSCTCNGMTFAIDCSQGCYPLDEQYATCNVHP